MSDNVIARHLRDLAANTGGIGAHATTLMTTTEAQQLNASEGFEYPVSGDNTTRWLWEGPKCGCGRARSERTQHPSRETAAQ